MLVPSGARYSLTSPVFGSSLPTYSPRMAVNQIFPSLSATSPCGPELGVLSGYSLNSPVLGSSRPNLFVCIAVYQSEPSGANVGSCGKDFAAGRSYSLISTLGAAAIAAAVNNIIVHRICLLIFILPPSRQILCSRWRKGGLPVNAAVQPAAYPRPRR